VISEHNAPPPAWLIPAGSFSVSVILCLLNFSITISNSSQLYAFLPNGIKPMYSVMLYWLHEIFKYITSLSKVKEYICGLHRPSGDMQMRNVRRCSVATAEMMRLAKIRLYFVVIISGFNFYKHLLQI
jgi:hypothetical protein